MITGSHYLLFNESLNGNLSPQDFCYHMYKLQDDFRTYRCTCGSSYEVSYEEHQKLLAKKDEILKRREDYKRAVQSKCPNCEQYVTKPPEYPCQMCGYKEGKLRCPNCKKWTFEKGITKCSSCKYEDKPEYMIGDIFTKEESFEGWKVLAKYKVLTIDQYDRRRPFELASYYYSYDLLNIRTKGWTDV